MEACNLFFRETNINRVFQFTSFFLSRHLSRHCGMFFYSELWNDSLDIEKLKLPMDRSDLLHGIAGSFSLIKICSSF